MGPKERDPSFGEPVESPTGEPGDVLNVWEQGVLSFSVQMMVGWGWKSGERSGR